MFRTIVGVSSVALGGTVVYAGYNDIIPSSFDGFYRFSRTSFNVVLTAADYKYTLSTHAEYNNERKEAIKNLNIRAAKRLYKVCRSHGGIYNKFAQYISTLNHVLPQEALDIIAPLQDKAKGITREEALEAIEKELKVINTQKIQSSNRNLNVIFKEFDETPVAAASLAQVHRAVLVEPVEVYDVCEKKTRLISEVAVKIQYPRLRKQTDGDVATITFLAKLLGYIFPDFEYSWLVPEFRDNLTLELDFVQEGKNAERVKKMFADRKDVYVPMILPSHTTKSLLMMEFVRGSKVTDIEAIVRDGIQPTKVAKTVTDVFGDMIHVHGFVHCDPHPGNLMVRKNEPATPILSKAWLMIKCGAYAATAPVLASIGLFPAASVAAVVSGGLVLREYMNYRTKYSNNYQLIVLDHGMYRRLQPDFRLGYCQLWKALLTRDDDLGRDSVRIFNIKEQDYDVLAMMFTFRPPKSKNSSKFAFVTGSRMTKDQVRELRDRFKTVTPADLNEFMQRLPRDLLFVLRNTNIVRSINLSLGGSTRDRFKSMGESAVKGLLVATTEELRQDIKLKVDQQEYLGPYRINLPVASEINYVKKPVSEMIAVWKLRFYLEMLDRIAQIILWWWAPKMIEKFEELENLDLEH